MDGGQAPAPLRSLIATGTKLWLDSIDPDLVKTNRSWGATGATSNPISPFDKRMAGTRYATTDVKPKETKRPAPSRSLASHRIHLQEVCQFASRGNVVKLRAKIKRRTGGPWDNSV